MIPVRTVRHADRLSGAKNTGPSKVPGPAEPSLADAKKTADWCERHGHPHGRLSASECFCGFIRYDD
jgi:hypothetical protein